MHWPDGRKFEIDRIMNVCMAQSLIGGGHGMRYKCRRIRNKQVNLFCGDLDGKWFLEHLQEFRQKQRMILPYCVLEGFYAN